MRFFIDHWLAIAVAMNTAILIFTAAAGRHVSARLAYLGRRIDKLDRALRDGTLNRVRGRRPEPVRLISDGAPVEPADAVGQGPYGRLRAVAR